METCPTIYYYIRIFTPEFAEISFFTFHRGDAEIAELFKKLYVLCVSAVGIYGWMVKTSPALLPCTSGK